MIVLGGAVNIHLMKIEKVVEFNNELVAEHVDFGIVMSIDIVVAHGGPNQAPGELKPRSVVLC